VFLGNIVHDQARSLSAARHIVVSQPQFAGHVLLPNRTRKAAQLYSATSFRSGLMVEVATDVNNVMYAYIDRKNYGATLLAPSAGTDVLFSTWFVGGSEGRQEEQQKAVGLQAGCRVLRGPGLRGREL
jgi:hypothetical protein